MPTAEKPKTREPIRYAAINPLSASKVDAAEGIFRDVAIMSIGEAAGHGCNVDMKTLEMLFALTSGKSVKAFLNHSWSPSPTEVVGIFSGFHIDAASGVLRAAQFKALGAFRKHHAEAFDTLFELATEAPEAFGVSVSIFQDLAWKKEDGTEILTDGWAPKPDGVVGDAPFIRPTYIESADFVGSPAANAALFSQKTVDTTPDSVQVAPVVETQSHINKTNPLFKMKAIYAKFSANPKALTRACQLAAEMPEGTKEEEIIDKVEEEVSAEAYAALVAERDALKTKVAEFEAKLAEQTPKVEQAAALSTKVKELETTVAQLSKSRGRFGAAPVNTGANAPEVKTITRAQFNAMDHGARNDHMAAGGKITE